MNKSFRHVELKLPEPKFGSELTGLVLELEHLRRMRLKGSTHHALFFELKLLFHSLESIGSARIEGNNTTLAQFIETKLEDRPYVNEDIEEIRNIESAMRWVDDIADEYPVNRSFVEELHKLIIKNLAPPPDGEGDRTSGRYREHQVEIQGAAHVPPPPYLINSLMEELFEFIASDVPRQYDLIRIAIAHHRFMWIHPFGNGNGRTGRLFTYAMLMKMGFRVHVGQILNPTAIFCIDRNRYGELLAKADTGTENNIESWTIYVLEGLLREIQKIERLADQTYVYNKLLLPALEYSGKMGYINNEEFEVLKIAASKKTVQAKDLRKSVLKDVHPVTVSRKIRDLREKNMLQSETDNVNKYRMSFINNLLIRGLIQALENEGYVPIKD